MNKKLFADILLVGVVICWGSSNYLINVCLTEMDPCTINMFRFVAAFLIAALLGISALKKVNKTTIKYALIMSVFMTLVYFFNTYGVKYTTISNAGFYCALAVIFAPLGEWLIFKKKLPKKMFLVVTICMVGIVMLSLRGDFSFNTSTMKGDILCIFCSIAYAFNIFTTEKAVSHNDVDALTVGILQLGFTGVFNTIIAFIFETPLLPSSNSVWVAIVILAVVCTGLAFILQPIAQQYTTSSHVGIIFSLDPVCCGIFAFFLAGEVLFPINYLGMLALVCGMLIMEIDFGDIFKKRKLIEPRE